MFVKSLILSLFFLPFLALADDRKLRFGETGQFKILQVADMHFANGVTTNCFNVLPSQVADCSDLNTTAFIERLILAEKPDLIVFTGDNIFGSDTKDPIKSMNAAFAPAIASNIPWAAILGNHDQQSKLSREELMKYIVTLKNTLSQVNPPAPVVIDGFGNYNLEVGGVPGTSFENKSLLNLYFLDSGDYSKELTVLGYDWIKDSQKNWYQDSSAKLKTEYMNASVPQKEPAPGIAYFHIPLPEFKIFDSSAMTGIKQENISSPRYNSGFFEALVNTGDVKAVFVGHDHVNDFCGELSDIQLCYAGGIGYHAYGKAGWERRARVVTVQLDESEKGTWGAVKSIQTWKRLDDKDFTTIDSQVLWTKKISVASSSEEQRKSLGFSARVSLHLLLFIWCIIFV